MTPGPAWALLSPIGRIGRLPYWLGFAFVWTVIAISMRIWWTSLDGVLTVEDLTMESIMQSNPLFPFLFMALQWVELALVIKRFQDMGRSGLFALTIFVPIVNILTVFAIGLMPGEPSANRYGPSTNSYFRRK